MSRHRNNKHNRAMLVMLGVLVGVAIGFTDVKETHAVECAEGSPYSCVSVTFGRLSGETTANPGKDTKSRLYFSMPVSIMMNQVKSYSVSIYDDNGGSLKSAGGVIPSVSTATSWKQLSEGSSAWGMRWTIGENDDGTKSFEPIPTVSKQATLAKDVAVNGRGTSTVDYTLGFGVVVDGDIAAGDYTDTLTVAVVAKPRDVTIFDIKNMQDMTPDICRATTTPSASATSADVDGSHIGDTNFVPETTLIDTRGGGIDGSGGYLVRKLADGNCWMSQNLELDILGHGQKVSNYKTSNLSVGNNDNVAVTADNYFGVEVLDGLVFTANDTDLNSTSIWTPEYFKKTYVDSGIAPYAKVYTTMSSTLDEENYEYGWADSGDDGVRSYSFVASNTDWSYSVLKTLGNDTTTSTFEDSAMGKPYDRRGNLYNWTAATLGSGLSLATDGQKAEDSLCPRGWQLPNNGVGVDTDRSFAKLLAAYGITTRGASIGSYNHLTAFPLQFPRTGFYTRSSAVISGRMIYGRWWSNTSSNNINSGRYLDSSETSSGARGYIDAQSSHWRGNGFAIRCVAR